MFWAGAKKEEGGLHLTSPPALSPPSFTSELGKVTCVFKALRSKKHLVQTAQHTWEQPALAGGFDSSWLTQSATSVLGTFQPIRSQQAEIIQPALKKSGTEYNWELSVQIPQVVLNNLSHEISPRPKGLG